MSFYSARSMRPLSLISLYQWRASCKVVQGAKYLSLYTRLHTTYARPLALEAPAKKSKKWKIIVGSVLLAVSLPMLKVYLALRPLLGQHSDGFLPTEYLQLSMPNQRAESASVTWKMWLASEASDRLIRDVYIAAKIIREYWLISKSGQADWSGTHQAAADLVLQLCKVNKGIYIKLGQHIGQLDYLLPEQFVRTLRVLCHAAPTDDWQLVRSMWRAEFGRDIEDYFTHIEQTPLASASLAQVHVGTLRSTGQRVAVKVQHAGLRETSHADIATVVALAHLVKAMFPRFDYMWLADEVQRNLPLELDFMNEARNGNRTRAAFASSGASIVVPDILPELTTHRVLTMSYEPGVYANDIGAIRAMGLQPVDVATLVSHAFSTQIFQLGWVHADPHAANLLVRPHPLQRNKPQLVLLDHGLYRELSPELRINYAKLWKSILQGNERGIAKYANRLGAGNAYQLFAAMLTTRSWDKILAVGDTADLDTLRAPASEEDKEVTAGYVREYADGIQGILRTIPRDLLLVLKTNDCLRAVDNALGAPANNYPIVARHCQAALNAKRAASRPGLLTTLQSAWDTAALEVRLTGMSWALRVARAWYGWGKAKGKGKGREQGGKVVQMA